jgi:hypothetical protein
MTDAPRTARRTPRSPTRPRQDQLELTRAAVQWYLELYHGTDEDVGVIRMFADPSRVGAFAVSLDALRRGEPGESFRLWVATTMFQRRQDLQIMRVLQGIAPTDAAALTDADGLRSAALRCGCPHAATQAGLIGRCDLHKDSQLRGACTAAPEVACEPKRHAVLLKRYGHFGKVPTSLAHAVAEAGARDLEDLRRRCISEGPGPAEAAERLERALCRAWRVSDKIAAMFLSMMANPDLWDGGAPWSDGLDWTRWVVIDSNVDLFLDRLGYAGHGTYHARRDFIVALADGIDLSTMKAGLQPHNPRLVQQAMYLFMSQTNRRSLARDCSHTPQACAACPANLAAACTSRRG